MHSPPLAGKIAGLSLGALPVFYALNHVSALSQCVQGAEGTAGPDWGVRWGPERGCAHAVGLAPGELRAPATSAWQDGVGSESSHRKSLTHRRGGFVLWVGVPLGRLRPEEKSR